MPEQVVDRELFHVWRQVPWNKHSPLKPGDVITVGDAYNPFFSFYETPSTFELTYADGTKARIPAVRFLEDVQAGNITAGNLPGAAVETARFFQKLSRELAMEVVRLEEAPGSPSRLKCLWTVDTYEEATQWKGVLASASCVLRLQATGTIARVDASQLTTDSEAYSVIIGKAQRYWREEISSPKDVEILFIGTAIVLEILV